MPRIAVLGIDGAQLASLATFLDVFDLVNRYGAQQYADREILPATLEVRVLSPNGRPLATQCGRSFPVDDSIAALGPPFDLVYAAGFEIGSALDLAARLQGLEPVCAWLQRQREAGAVIAASGAGVLLLADCNRPGQAALFVRSVLAGWFFGGILERAAGLGALVGIGALVYFGVAFAIGGIDREAISSLRRKKAPQ